MNQPEIKVIQELDRSTYSVIIANEHNTEYFDMDDNPVDIIHVDGYCYGYSDSMFEGCKIEMRKTPKGHLKASFNINDFDYLSAYSKEMLEEALVAALVDSIQGNEFEDGYSDSNFLKVEKVEKKPVAVKMHSLKDLLSKDLLSR